MITGLTLERMRTLHGLSTRAWVGAGTHIVGDGHWIALSGARHVDYNMALCHGPRGAEHVPECLERITATKRPSIIALAGEACATDHLAEAGWARVGDAPLMVRATDTADAEPDPAVRQLTAEELPSARALVAAVFGLPPDIAEVALTVDPLAVPDRSVWGLFEADRLVTTVVLMHVEDAVVVWSMATDLDARRRGYGRRVMHSVLAAARAAGAGHVVLHASTDGEPLYRSVGFQVAERWELWSRRRWVLAAE